LSINIGSLTYQGNDGVKGINEYTIQTRPINDLISQIEKKEFKLKNLDELIIGIVGGGVAGIELAFSIKARFMSKLNNMPKVYIFSNSNSGTIPGFNDTVVNNLTMLLSKSNIAIIYNANVIEVTENGLYYSYINNNSDNIKEFFKLDLILWATGAGPQQVNFNVSLQLDDSGFILVRDTLQVLDYDYIFAAGDCIQLNSYKNENPRFPPKAGVYAVREGSVLADNIFKYINGDELIEYIPQREFLTLVTMGNRIAFGTKFGISFYGKWVWEMKEFIDVTFVKMFEDKLNDVDKVKELIDNTCVDVDDEKLIVEKFTNFEGEDFGVQLKVLDIMKDDEKFCGKIVNLLNKLNKEELV
jgi:NADH dehydrogenase FAD-containing subunit